MPDADNQDAIEEIQMESEERMQKSVDSMQRDILNIRSGRAAPSMVEHLQVEYYGAPTPLIQLASVSVPEARQLVISPFDKASAGDIEKAILKSDLNLTPQNDGSVIRLILPELSGERRKELVKQLKARLEEAKISIRNIRRDSNDAIKKLSGQGISEDEIKSNQDEIQKLTDEYIAKLETMATKKEEDILTI